MADLHDLEPLCHTNVVSEGEEEELFRKSFHSSETVVYVMSTCATYGDEHCRSTYQRLRLRSHDAGTF